MDYEIKLALRQNSTNNDDGMDVCLINIQPEKQGYKVEFAGAMRPLFYYSMQNNSVEMVKGTVRAIGGLFKSEFMFQNVELNLHSGDILYLTSDGYLDQPNDRRKTIGTKRFTNLIADIAHLPMEEQKLALENHLIHHSESQQQRDDITLMAIKFNEIQRT